VSTDHLPSEVPRTGLTRRILLVAGGLTLLAGCSDAAEQVAYVTRAPASHAPSGPGQVHLGRQEQRLARNGRPGRRAARRHKHRAAEESPMFYVNDGRKGIALTIDDGPNPVYTPQILRLLEKYRVTASFSMIGLEVDTYRGVAREVAAAGHVIANHTWSHPDLAHLSPVAVADQMNRAADAIHKVTGRVPTLFRAPYGAWSPAVFRQCARTGMTPLDWSVDPRDWSRPADGSGRSGQAARLSQIRAVAQLG
jgi:peptidoglycan/xylan/chitin deacetylase (PgdA/CDA1 family)